MTDAPTGDADSAPTSPPAAAGPAPRSSRRGTLLFPLLILALIGGTGFGYWYLVLRGVISTDDAFVDGNRVSMSSRILGRIVELHADEGDTVRQGDVLVGLDDTDLTAQAAQAEASLAYAEENARLAAVQLTQARDDFTRATSQFEAKVIPREQYDHAATAVDIAEARQRIAAAQIQTARAQLGVVRAQLANTTILAPLSGVVARRWVLPGDVVQAGQPILAIYELDRLWITANFEETKVARIHPGDAVQVTVDAYPGRDLAGTVEWIGAAAASQFSLIPPNNASGNFTKVTQRIPVRIALARAGPADSGLPPLVPGMSVEVTIRTPDR